MERSSGVLLHPSSLPNPYGAGDLGPQARAFVAWLGRARQRWWQVLPLGPVDDGGSPYNSPSAFAGDPLLLSLDDLLADGWLDTLPALSPPPGNIDHAWLRATRLPLVRAAARRVGERVDLAAFADAHPWLRPWARFRACKDAYPDRGFWDQPAGVTPDAARIQEELGVQWLFAQQWSRLREAARAAGVGIIGDLPIFVSADSADVADNPGLFLLGSDGRPEVVAGVPPDAFSPTGQKWGMPLYDWDAHRADGFAWWRQRLTALLERVDLVRVDHFRGFEAAWHVPESAPDASSGRWVPGAGEDLFDALAADFDGPLPVIAEDLGVITPPVEALRDRFGLPGMKILQFAFGGEPDHPYLPHRYPENCVVYTGTHDNQTSVGWWQGIGEHERDRVRATVGHGVEEPSWALMELAWRSRAVLAVAPAQDVLGLDDRARFNVPGLSEGNWAWRLDQAMPEAAADRLAALTLASGRG